MNKWLMMLNSTSVKVVLRSHLRECTSRKSSHPSLSVLWAAYLGGSGDLNFRGEVEILAGPVKKSF